MECPGQVPFYPSGMVGPKPLEEDVVECPGSSPLILVVGGMLRVVLSHPSGSLGRDGGTKTSGGA